MAGNGSFMVDLAALSDAIGQVSGERDTMAGGITSLRSIFSQIEDSWQSPAASTFVSATENFNAVTDNLMGLLDDAISRMRTAYQNYSSTEATNTQNLH